MPTQRIYAASCASYVSHQHLQHRSGTDNLRTKAMLGPAHGIDDGRHLLHVPIFADRGVKIGCFEELILRNSGNALGHLRGVTLILLLEKLEDAPRMLQGKVEGDLRRQQGHGRGASFCSRWTRALISLALAGVAALDVRCWWILPRRRRQNRLSRPVSAFFICP